MQSWIAVLSLVPLLLGLAGGVARASDVSVFEERVVPGALTVEVYAHSLTTQRGPLPVWTFVSKGLWARHQKEIRITVKREPKEAAGDYPRDLLALYRAIHAFAGQGRLVDVGGRTRLGPEGPGLLGRDEFRCLLYTRAQSFEGVPIDVPSLTALIVTCNEAEAAARFGLTRLMARLGRAERFYPTTPWADRQRPDLVGAKGNEGSVLAQGRVAALPAAHVRRERAEKIVLTLLPGAREALGALLERAPEGGFALLVTVDPAADSCLVWEPGQERTEGIAAPGSQGERVAGNFVLLLDGGGASDRGGLVEDGFVLSFTPANWRRVRDVLDGGRPLSLPMPGGAFEIVWLPSDYADPVSGGTYRSPGGWQTFLPNRPAPPVDGPVAMDHIVLLTPEDEVAGRTSAEALAAFTKQIEAAVRAEVAATPLQGAVLLIVDYQLEEPPRQAFRLAFQQDGPRPFADRLQRRLDGLAPPKATKGPIHLQVYYRITQPVAPTATPTAAEPQR